MFASNLWFLRSSLTSFSVTSTEIPLKTTFKVFWEVENVERDVVLNKDILNLSEGIGLGGVASIISIG